MIEGRQDGNGFWMRLDNAAKIYPAIRNRESTSVMRISVDLKERIKARQFAEAVRIVEKRFPYYKMKLLKGFFWYYLEYQNYTVRVSADLRDLCRSFREEEIMYRILVRENRISIEFSHILTDGTGAFEFLKTLLLVYLEKCGIALPPGISFLHPEDQVSEEEYEDAFKRYFKKSTSPLIRVTQAFHLPFTLNHKPRFNVLLGIVSVREITTKAKEFRVSLTEYLIAVYLNAMQEVYLSLPNSLKRKSNKEVRIEVPMNLRRVYPSKTMRNFSLYVMPEIDLRLGRYTFEELIKVVYHQMHLETDKKLINKMISRNVGSEMNPFIRSMPLIIKSIVLSKVYTQATGKYSGVITNLGKIDFGPEINSHIRRFIFIAPPTNKVVKINCGVVGFEDQLVLSFGNITASKNLEKYFFSFLSSQGIHVKIENY